LLVGVQILVAGILDNRKEGRARCWCWWLDMSWSEKTVVDESLTTVVVETTVRETMIYREIVAGWMFDSRTMARVSQKRERKKEEKKRKFMY